MPPQNNALPSVPGEDKLLDSLRNSPLRDDQRKQLWEVYHTQGDQKAFTGALNTLDMDDSTKKAMYEMRWPQPSPVTKQTSNLDARPQAKGDVRPSNQDIQNQRIQDTNKEVAAFWGRMVPDAAVPALAAANRYLVQPFEKMSQTGAQVGGVAARVAAIHAGITGPTGQGAAEGAGELAGGVVADPRMWPFALEGAAKGALSKLAAKGFSTQMLMSAANTVPEVRDAIKRGDHYEAARLMTMGLGSAALGSLGLKEESGKSQGATPQGPTSSIGEPTKGGLEAATNAPKEAHAPVTATGATKVSDAPLVDRQAVIAPKPTDYTGQAPLIPSYKLPSDKLLATGGTRGLGPVDLASKGPFRVETDNLGVKGAVNDQGVRVSVPKGVQDADVQGYAAGKIAEQVKAQADIKSKVSRQLPSSDELEDAFYKKGVGAAESHRLAVQTLQQAGDTTSVAPGYADLHGAIKEQALARIDRIMGPEQRSVPREAPSVQRDVPKLLDQLHGNFNKIADLNRMRDQAENDSHADELGRQHKAAEEQLTGVLRQDMTKWKGEDVSTFRDGAVREADKLDAQAKAIKDLTEATIKNRGVKNDITDLRSQGGPPREAIIDPETGERAIIKPQDRVGRGGRSVLDELQGRVPTSDFSKLEVAGKPEGVSDQEWAEHVGKLQEERNGLKRKISDAVTIASETGASVADMGIEEHVDRLKQIESMMGKYADPSGPGRRPNIPAEVDEQGAIKAPEALKSWTLERARLALGAPVRQIPTDEEFFQHADLRSEKARLFRNAASVADGILDARKKEGGFVGEGPLKGKVEPVSLKDRVPSDEEVMKRALAARLYARTADSDFPAGRVGLLSKDGKTWVDSGRAGPNRVDTFRGMRDDTLSHDEVAEKILPELAKRGPFGETSGGEPLRAMLDKGWIRKAGPNEYEAHNLDPTTVKTIEMDLYRNGIHGQSLFFDSKTPFGQPKGINIDSGWDEKYNSLQDAIDAAKRKQGWSSEVGAIKGRTLLASSTVGGLVGGVVGAHLGDPYLGTGIGWGLGFITPAIVDHPAFWNTVNAIKPDITSLGIKMSDWLAGPKQNEPVNAAMKDILDAQKRDLKGPAKSMLSRVAQLPGDLQNKLFDKFVFFNDRPGAMVNLLMKFDPRGAEFRDLRGKLDVDNSPYVSAWLAAGGGGGMAEAHLLDYKKMYSEAQGKGLVNNLNEYLNLKGYQRVYDVMQERIADHDQSIQKMQAALQQKGLPVEVEAGIKKALRESKADRQDIIDKLVSKTLVPAPYDPPKIAADLQNLQMQLAHQGKFADVQRLAEKVFALNRKVLDMTHDAGIIGDADYQKYTGRGDEYIPMHRILEQIADNTGRTSGKGSPLYLRQQNVIKALMGSDRINRDPIIASADANLEAMREVARNNVTKDMLKLAQADPQGVGSLFKEVKSGYKAQPDEGLVGFYDGGIQHTFAVPSYLAESLKNVSPASMDIIGKGPLQYFGQILRKGATMGNLAWSVPNALRHLGDMAIMSDAGLKDIRTLPRDVSGLIREWNKSLYSTIVNDSARQEYLRSGAAYSTLQSQISPEEKLDPTTLGFKQKVAHGRVIDVVADFNKAVEDATKMTTFKRLRQAGYSEKGAAWETRRYGGGPDFARQGNLTPAIGMVSMFFNAHLQYVTRAFARAAEQPVRVGVALAAITAMAMTLNEHNYNQKDEKGNLLMRKVPYTDRENNFVVLTGDTYQSSSGATLPVYYKVPKPSFVKFLYNPIENTINKIDGHEERSGTQLGLQAIGNLSPGQMDLQQGQVGASAVRGAVSSLNPVIRAPLEEAMNYKTTGVGAPIVPGREQNIDPRFQYSPNTSEMAKRLGEGGWRGATAGAAEGTSIGYLLGGPKGAAIGGGLGTLAGSFGVSPRRAEHVIDTTTAGVGRIATGFVDPFLGGVKQTRMEGPEKLANTPIAGPILGRFVSTSIDQQEQALTQQFYMDAQKAQQPMQTIEFLKKNHPEQLPDYIQSHKDDLWKAQIATTMQSRLGQISNAQKTVEQNQAMSDKDRAEALKNLHAVKMQVLKVFTGVMRPSPQVGQAAALPGQGQGAPR